MVREPGSLAVLLAVEQLRRRVPGGIGTYARGLLGGLAACAAEGDPVEVTLLASRAPRGGAGDPLDRFGRPTVVSRLPAPTPDPRLGPWAGPHAGGVRRGALGVHGVTAAPARRQGPPGRDGPRRGLAAPSRGDDPARAALARGGAGACPRRGGLAPRPVPSGRGRPGRRRHRGAPHHRRAQRSRPPAGPRSRGGRRAARPAGRARGVPPDGRHARAAQERGPPGAGVRAGAGLVAGPVAAGGRRTGRVGAEPARPGDADGVVFTGALGDSVLAGVYRRARAFAYVPLPRGTASRPWRRCGPGSRPWCPTRCPARTTSARPSRRRRASSIRPTSTTSPAGWPTS